MKYHIEGIAKPAKTIVERLHDHRIVAFHGPMGAGKTTLIREICAQLGVTDPVTSPTFALVNKYLADDGRTIYHFDFYRVENPRQALDFGVEEYLDSGDICLIEWPEKILELLPENLLVVAITPSSDDDAREIEIRTV